MISQSRCHETIAHLTRAAVGINDGAYIPGANTERNTGRMVTANSAANSGISAPANRAISGALRTAKEQQAGGIC